jgi:hypothetical protein
LFQKLQLAEENGKKVKESVTSREFKLNIGILHKTFIMSTIFDEFYNSDSEDEAPSNQNHFSLKHTD